MAVVHPSLKRQMYVWQAVHPSLNCFTFNVSFFLLSFLFFYSFLSLVPEEVKSSAQTGDTGYDTYLRDAHRQVGQLAKWSYQFSYCRELAVSATLLFLFTCDLGRDELN